jgi:glycosyltransferase involved in cell wall biosynthesis
METRNNLLVVLPSDYLRIGGIKIPATNYIAYFERKFIVNKVLMDYHLVSFKEKKRIRTELLSKIDSNTKAIIVFSGINQAFITMQLLSDGLPKTCKKIFYSADSPLLYMKSYLELCKEDIKSLFDRLKYNIKAIVYNYKESKTLKIYDEVIYVSPVDARFVYKEYKRIEANISVIPNGTDIQEESKFVEKIDAKNFRLGFLSAINEQTYIESIKPLIYEIMPKIIDKVPNTKLLIVGKGTSSKRVEEIRKLSYVEYIDYVEDLDDFYRNIDIVIAPIRKRNGILNKVIEAWGYGKCTVGYDYNFDAFVKGIEGTHYISGRDSDEIAKKISKITCGDIDISAIGKAAYELAKEEYNWISQKQKFMKIID